MSVSLAWVTPYSGLSDVSAFSRNIVHEFARVADTLDVALTVVVNEHGPTFWCPLPVVALSGTDADRELLAGFDVVVFNIGNNTENHGHINRLAVEVPGVVVVHDLVMQHYFAFQTFERLRRKDAYARLIGEYYGTTGLDVVGLSQICAAQQAAIYSPWDTLHVARMPLIEPFMQTASAVVVHSAYAEASVRPMTDAPLLRLALPWDQKGEVPDAAVAEWGARTAAAHRCHFAAFGHISRNKSLHLMIEAFGTSDPLRARASLVIAGYSGDRGYAEELRAQVAQLGLERVVRFAYDATDTDLRHIKHEADAFLNLRYPNTESASGSLVEQLNTGKPVLLFPGGSYAEVPDGAAIRVAREDGISGLVAAMERVMADPVLRQEAGAAGRAHVRRLGAREYVASLWDFLRHHAPLLQRRQRLAVGTRRPAIGGEADAAWLARVAATRRMMAGLALPAIDVAPFRDWPEPALLRFAAVGLFGQTLGSRGETVLRALLHRHGRAGLHRIVAEAWALWQLTRLSTTEFLAQAPAEPILHAPAYAVLAAIDVRLFARACYLGLLRRPPQDVEVDRYAARAQQEPLGRLMGEFVRSEEFRARAADPAALAVMARDCEALLALNPVLPPLAEGRLLEVSSRDPACRGHLLAGWHNIEEGGVWSRGGLALIGLRVAEPAEPSAPKSRPLLRLALRLVARFATAAANQVLRLALDGGPVTRHVGVSDAWFTLDIPLPASAATAGCVLELDSGPPVNLLAAGVANDPRELGIRLKSFAVVARDVPERPPQEMVEVRDEPEPEPAPVTAEPEAA